MKFTTPFPTAIKTEDVYYCRRCRHYGPADEVADSLSCELCDSDRVVRASVRRAELNREDEAHMAEWDRRAEQSPEARAAELRRCEELADAISEGAFFKRRAGAA